MRQWKSVRNLKCYPVNVNVDHEIDYIGGVHVIYVESVDVDIDREVDDIGCVYGVHVDGVCDYVGILWESERVSVTRD